MANGLLPILFIVLSNLVVGCVGGDFCYYYSYSYSTTTFYYCGTGCCGYYYNRECCSNVGTIAGAVVGGLIVVGIIIGIVICCIVTQQAQKRKIKKRQEETAAMLTILTHNTGYGGVQPPHGQQPYGHAPAPPDYSPFGPTGGRGGHDNPAYPPAGQPRGGVVETSHMAPPPYNGDKAPL